MGQTSSTTQAVNLALAPSFAVVPELQVGADSPAGDGVKSVLSAPIDDISPEEFWELFEKELRREHSVDPWDASHVRKSFERPDGGILVVPIVPTGTGRRVALHVVWYLQAAEGRAVGISYDTDETLSTEAFRVTLRTYREPFRIESRTTICEQRDSGESLKEIMEKVLAGMGSKARCFHDVQSPASPGLRSVLSEEILDAAASPETFWRQTKEYIRAEASEVLPDGSAVQRLRNRWAFWDDATHYTKHAFDDAVHEVRSYSYGPDASLSEVKRVSHLKVHLEPYQLEMFTITPEHAVVGESEKAFLLDLLLPVFSRRWDCSEEADPGMLAGLSEELKSSHKEVRGLLAALHTNMLALQSVPTQAPATA